MKKVILLFVTIVIPHISFTQNGKAEHKVGEPMEQTIQIVVEPEVLKCYVGTYLLRTDTLEIDVEIKLNEDRLMYIEKRGNRTFEAELHPLSSTKFFFKENNAIVHFNNSINCETPSFDISIDGETNKFIRM